MLVSVVGTAFRFFFCTAQASLSQLVPMTQGSLGLPVTCIALPHCWYFPAVAYT